MEIHQDESPGPESVTTVEWSALAESRSRTYGFLAAVYNRLPDDQFAQSLLSDEFAGFLFSLLNDEQLPEAMRDGLRLIEEFARNHQGTPVEELRTQLGVDRTRLLRGVQPGYGPPPPYESVYAGSEGAPQMQASASIRQTYAEAGVGLSEEVRDQPDFIGLELDFMRHLTAKEAQAWVEGSREQALEILEKERAFLQEHIVRWVPRFCDVMHKEARLSFYGGIAKLTKGFVQDEAEKVAMYLEWGAATASGRQGGKDE
jgi:TorA maturation chaperone TorD